MIFRLRKKEKGNKTNPLKSGQRELIAFGKHCADDDIKDYQDNDNDDDDDNGEDDSVLLPNGQT